MSSSSNQGHGKMPVLPKPKPGLGEVLATAFLNAVRRQLPLSQVIRGDDRLMEARDLVVSSQSEIAEYDLKVIEDKITQ